MVKRSKYKFSIKGEPLYPHIKLTRERFPRILATRIIADDDAEYYGAFLSRTNTRMLIDFLNRTFKLRSCDIEIDGSFNYPCTMYYKKRCLAPCVEDLIDDADYGEMVSLVRLFLQNDRVSLRDSLNARIRSASDELYFENAAKWRNIRTSVEEYWTDTRNAVWLDTTSDTIYVRAKNNSLNIVLISQRGRRVLGDRTFGFSGVREAEANQALSEVIEQFYRFHAPGEIRIHEDFSGRKKLERMLSAKYGRRVPILLLNQRNRKISTELAIDRAGGELDVRRSIVSKSPRELMVELKRSFNLPKIPKRISAIDVSHLSGTNQVAGAISWEEGRTVSTAAEYLLSDSDSELETLREFVNKKYKNIALNIAELLLIDGGRSQLNAASSQISDANVGIISAVKPPRQHSRVSHFLTANGRIEFDPANDGHRLLQRLRDAAHEFANAVHRDTREFEKFYEVVHILPSLTESERQRLLLFFGSHAAIAKATCGGMAKVIGRERAQIAARDIERYESQNYDHINPLVMPIRFQEENGAADDLLPITTNQHKVQRSGR